MTNLKDAWRKFRAGDAITDAELDALLVDVNSGLDFLLNRGEAGGVVFKARLDREALENLRNVRRED